MNNQAVEPAGNPASELRYPGISRTIRRGGTPSRQGFAPKSGYFPLLARLVCPKCKVKLNNDGQSLNCRQCGRSFPLIEGRVPVFIPREKQVGSGVWEDEKKNLFRGAAPDKKQSLIPPKWTAKFDSWMFSAWAHVTKLLSPLVWRMILAWLRRKNRRNPPASINPKMTLACDKIRNTPYDAPYLFYMRSIFTYYLQDIDLVSPSLEIGGNCGHFTKIVFPPGTRLDYCSEYLEVQIAPNGKLRRRVIDQIFDQIFISEAHELPMRDNSLKTMIMMHLISHITELDKALAEFSRVLAPGGRIYMNVQTNHTVTALWDFAILKKVGLLSESYINWRQTRRNPRQFCAFVRHGSYPEGQNRLSLEQWREHCGRYGLKIKEAKGYMGVDLAQVMDTEWQGFSCPRNLIRDVHDELHQICQRDIAYTPQNPWYYMLTIEKDNSDESQAEELS